jgi:hypothetical protein
MFRLVAREGERGWKEKGKEKEGKRKGEIIHTS